MKHEESDNQMMLIKWWALAHRGLGVPHENLLFAIPNGGARNAITGAVLKREGVRAGTLDLFLSVPRAPYHGFYIEMKSAKGHPNEAQEAAIPMFMSQGYHVRVCRGFDEAKSAIESYLKLPKPA